MYQNFDTPFFMPVLINRCQDVGKEEGCSLTRTTLPVFQSNVVCLFLLFGGNDEYFIVILRSILLFSLFAF